MGQRDLHIRGRHNRGKDSVMSAGSYNSACILHGVGEPGSANQNAIFRIDARGSPDLDQAQLA